MEIRWKNVSTRTLPFLLIGAAFTALVYAGYHQFYQKGLQAEVHIITSYLHTLEQAYATEKGDAVRFSDYGAPSAGRDNCAQPEGAAELGFIIAGCHELRAVAPRYMFRVIDSDASRSIYSIEAESGSDAKQRSLVCFEASAAELWVSPQNSGISIVKSCW